MLKIFRKSAGTTVLETALTLPIILYLIFFCIEIIKIKDVQTALDSIATEAAIQFMSSLHTDIGRDVETPGNQDGIQGIIEKYRPKYIRSGDINYYFVFFNNDNSEKSQGKGAQNQTTVSGPYMPTENIAVYWPASDNAQTAQSAWKIVGSGSEKSGISLSNYKMPENSNGFLVSGKKFILTFVVKYNFSSSFVGKLFGGGTNTENRSGYLLWSRSVGICR